MPLKQLPHISFILALEFIIVCIMCGVAGAPLRGEKRLARHRRHPSVKYEKPEAGSANLAVTLQNVQASIRTENKEFKTENHVTMEVTMPPVTVGVQRKPTLCSDCPAWFFDDENKRNNHKDLPVNLMILPLVFIFSFMVYILVKATHWCKEDIMEADEKEIKVILPPNDVIEEQKPIIVNQGVLRCQGEAVKRGSVKSASVVSWKDDVKQYKRSKSEIREIRRDKVEKANFDSRSLSVDGSVTGLKRGSEQKRTSRPEGKSRKTAATHNDYKSAKPSVRPLKLDRKGKAPTNRRSGKGARGGCHMPYRTGSTRSNQSSTSSPNSSRLRLLCQTVPHSDSLSPSTTCSSGYSSSVFRYDYQRAGSISSVESPSCRRSKLVPRGRIDPTDNLNTPDSFNYPSTEAIPFTPSDEAFLPPFKYVCDISASSPSKRLCANSPGSTTSLPVHLRSESTSGHSSIHQSPVGSAEKLVVAGGQHPALEKKDSSYGSLPDNSKAYQHEDESSSDSAIKVGREHRLSSMDGTLLDLHNKQHEAMSLRKKLMRYLLDNQKMTMELHDMFHTENKSCPCHSSDITVTPSAENERSRRKVKSWCVNDAKDKGEQKEELLDEVCL